MKKTLLLLTIAVLGMVTLASADSFVTYVNRAQQPATDLLDWGQLGAPGTLINTTFPGTTFNGNPFLAGNINGSQFVAAQENVNWFGGFDIGENLMWTGNSNNGFGGLGPFEIAFLAPVSNFGFGIEADFILAPFTATIEALDINGNPIYTNTWSGNLGCGFGNSCVTFIGVGDLTGANIGAILISTNSGGAPWDNDFAIDDVTLGYGNATPLPEPGSLVLMGTGLLGIAGLVRRKLNL